MITSDFSAFDFEGGADGAQLFMRVNGQNVSCKMSTGIPDRPYIVLRAGGKNNYAKLVPANDENASALRILRNSIVLSPALETIAQQEADNGRVSVFSEDTNSADFYLGGEYYGLSRQNGSDIFLNKDSWGSWSSKEIAVGDEILLHHSEKKGSVTNNYAGKYEVRKVKAIADYYDEANDDYYWRVTLDQTPDLDLTNYYVQALPIITYKTLVMVGSNYLDNTEYVIYTLENGTLREAGKVDWDTLEKTNNDTAWFYYLDYEIKLFATQEEASELFYDNGYDGTYGPVGSGIYANVNGVRKNIYIIDINGGNEKKAVIPLSYDAGKGHTGGIVAVKVTNKLIFLNGSFEKASQHYGIDPPYGECVFVWARNIIYI